MDCTRYIDISRSTFINEMVGGNGIYMDDNARMQIAVSTSMILRLVTRSAAATKRESMTSAQEMNDGLITKKLLVHNLFHN